MSEGRPSLYLKMTSPCSWGFHPPIMTFAVPCEILPPCAIMSFRRAAGFPPNFTFMDPFSIRFGRGIGSRPAGVDKRWRQRVKSPCLPAFSFMVFTLGLQGKKTGIEKCVPAASGTSQLCMDTIVQAGFPIMNLFVVSVYVDH